MKEFFVSLLKFCLGIFVVMLLGIYIAKTVIDRSDDGSVRRELDSLRRETLQLKRGQAEIKAKLDTVISNQTDFKSDLDTLKAGQEVIYNQVKKYAEKSFCDWF